MHCNSLRHDSQNLLPSNCSAATTADVRGADSVGSVPPGSVIDERFRRAFGVLLLQSDGSPYNDPWCVQWSHIVCTKKCLYDLPSGSVGRHFIDLLTSEVSLLTQGSALSEMVLVFLVETLWFVEVQTFALR